MYLSQRALNGLKHYKYKPGGYTPMDSFHQQHWNYVTYNWLPEWLAPNLITLTGMSALVFVYVLAAFLSPNFSEPLPPYMFFAFGTANLFYLHMDALDGKQARRTKTSSPLGQLFDHGCDALAVHLVLHMMLSSLELAYSWKAVASMMYVYIPWLMAHWEEYQTGMMVIGNGFWGVTEANYAVVALHYFTFAVGEGFWNSHPFVRPLDFIGKYVVLPEGLVKTLSGLHGNESFLLFMGIFGITMLTDQLQRVFRLAGSKVLLHTTLPRADRGHKQLGKGAAAFHLAQLAVMYIAGTLMLLPAGKGDGEVRVRAAMFGAVYALQATRLIVAHMAKEPFTIAAWPIVAMLTLVVNESVYPFADPIKLAYVVGAIVIAGYMHYIVKLISEICTFFGIKAFSIQKDD